MILGSYEELKHLSADDLLDKLTKEAASPEWHEEAVVAITKAPEYLYGKDLKTFYEAVAADMDSRLAEQDKTRPSIVAATRDIYHRVNEKLGELTLAEAQESSPAWHDTLVDLLSNHAEAHSAQESDELSAYFNAALLVDQTQNAGPTFQEAAQKVFDAYSTRSDTILADVKTYDE